MRIFGIGRCPAVGNFAVLLIPPKPPLPFAKHPLPLRLEIRPVPRPRCLAVLTVLTTQLLRLSVDAVEYRQTVGEPPQSESESLGARSPAFICFLHDLIIGGLERRRKWVWDLNFQHTPRLGACTPRVWWVPFRTNPNNLFFIVVHSGSC